MKFNKTKIIFVAPENSLGLRFQHYRKIKKFTDVKVKAGDIEIDAHRMVLEEASPVIKTMFESSCFDENVLEFKKENVDPEILEDLLNVFYTTQIEISDQNAYSLCIASHFLEIPNLLKECETFLTHERIFDTNVVDLYCLSCLLKEKIIKKNCLDYFETKDAALSFTNIFENSKLIALNFNEIKEFLIAIINGNRHRNFIFLNLKENIFHFINLWIEYDLESRKIHHLNLLQILPLKELSDCFLMKDVLVPSYVNKLSSCSKLFNETLEEIHSASQTLDGSRLYCLRGDMKFSIYYLNVMNGKWRTLIELPNFRDLLGTAVIGKNIYFCEGFLKQPIHLRMFDCEQKTLNTICRMPSNQRSFGMTTLNGIIFIAGGYDYGQSSIPTVLQYSLSTKKWTRIKEMNERRCEFRLVALNGLIYAIGGDLNGTVECYNPATNEWSYVATFGITDRYLIVISAHNRIYALDNQKFEAFNPEINTWIKLPYPPIRKQERTKTRLGQLVFFNDKLLLFGCYDSKHPAKRKILFEFNMTKESWNKLLDIDHEPCFSEAVVVNL